MHKSEEARRELELVRREVGDHPNVFYYLGRLDLDDQQYASAAQNLTRAATRPPFPDTAYYLGYAYFNREIWQPLRSGWSKASQLIPRDARVPYQLALSIANRDARRTRRRHWPCRRSYAGAIPRTASEDRMQQKLDQGPPEEAHTVCEQLYDPDNVDKLTELGTIYGQHGDLEAALKPLRRAAELPRNRRRCNTTLPDVLSTQPVRAGACALATSSSAGRIYFN